MTGKKLPAAEWVYMVYDTRDRLVAIQDVVQRTKNPDEWTFTKYDALDRSVMTGIYKVADGTSQAMLQTTVNGFTTLFEDRLTSGYGYTNNSSPTQSGSPAVALVYDDLLTLTYYDSYGFQGAYSFSNSYSNISGYN